MVPVETIERMIDDFRTRIEKLEAVKGVSIVDGAILGYSEVINELRKVVADYGKGQP